MTVYTRISKLLAAGIVALGSAAAAQAQNLIYNGDFSAGFTGWSQRLTSSNAVGLPGSIVTFQTNSSQPPSAAARYMVGQVTFVQNHREGVVIAQQVNLQQGSTYRITYDWASLAHPQSANAEGGYYEVLVDGQSFSIVRAGHVDAGRTVRGSVHALFTASRTGLHEVGARITRANTTNSLTPHQHIDNLAMIPTGPDLAVNGNFSAGFTNWTQRNTANGVGAPGTISTFETRLGRGASSAARYRVGQQVYYIGQREGVELVQWVTLQQGGEYLLSLDWAAQADPVYHNGEGGYFEIIVDGQNLAIANAGTIAAGEVIRGSISGSFTAARSGSHEVGVRITRAHLATSITPLQYVDDFEIVQTGGFGPPPLQLSVSGVCPGTIVFDVSNATPNGLVGIVAAYCGGSFVIPQGMTCAGTRLDLCSNGIRLYGTVRADFTGRAVVASSVSDCNLIWQAIDAQSCRTSN